MEDKKIEKICQSCKFKCKQWHTVYYCKKYKKLEEKKPTVKGGKKNGDRVLSNK